MIEWLCVKINDLGLAHSKDSDQHGHPPSHGMQRRMISVDNIFVFLRLLFFAVLLLYVT